MNQMGKIFFLSLIIALFWAIPGSFGQESEANQAQLKKYMETYKNYLKAKIANDPAADERLKEYNQAYSEYIKFLRISIPQKKPTESPEPAKTVSAPTSGSDNAQTATGSRDSEYLPGPIASEALSSPALQVDVPSPGGAPGERFGNPSPTAIPITSETISIPASGASSTNQ